MGGVNERGLCEERDSNWDRVSQLRGGHKPPRLVRRHVGNRSVLAPFLLTANDQVREISKPLTLSESDAHESMLEISPFYQAAQWQNGRKSRADSEKGQDGP